MAIDRSLLEQAFLKEAEETLQEAEEVVLAAGFATGDAEAISTLFRLMHTMKGSAATVGFMAVANLAHALEDLLDLLRAGNLRPSPDLVTLHLDTLDALRQTVAAGMEPATLPRSHALVSLRIKRLVELASRRAGTASPPRDEALVDAAAPAHVAPAAPAAVPSAPAIPVVPETTPAEPTTSRGPDQRRVLRVDVEKLDRMLDLIGEIGISRGRLERALQVLDEGAVQEALDTHDEADRLYRELQEMVLKARMVPLGPLFRPHQRTVRDLAGALGKEATLEMEGGNVEIDTAAVDGIRDALTHMVRNAMGHGIESPAVREAAGKPRAGRIVLRARQEGATIVVEIEDDGAGLDRDRILARAAERGWVAEGVTLPDEVAYEFIFRPGFSTAREVTGLSGRGVGLDVVRSRMHALRGDVTVRSRPGHGTVLALRIPLSLTLIDGLYVGLAEDTYVIPVDAVVECVNVESPVRAKDLLPVRGRAVPYVRLREYFQLGRGRPGRESAVVVSDGSGVAGLGVDVIYGQMQAVVKPMSRGLGKTGVISGSAIMGSGRVALLLDVPALMRQMGGVGVDEATEARG